MTNKEKSSLGVSFEAALEAIGKVPSIGVALHKVG
jgi:hypothetical protein